jgi:hypothetical protein
MMGRWRQRRQCSSKALEVLDGIGAAVVMWRTKTRERTDVGFLVKGVCLS